MDNFIQYISENALILIPVLYVLGTIIKNTKTINDKYIPVILLALGIAFSSFMNGISADSVIQGVLVTGTTVFGNQLVKQAIKEE